MTLLLALDRGPHIHSVYVGLITEETLRRSSTILAPSIKWTPSCLPFHIEGTSYCLISPMKLYVRGTLQGIQLCRVVVHWNVCERETVVLNPIITNHVSDYYSVLATRNHNNNGPFETRI